MKIINGIAIGLIGFFGFVVLPICAAFFGAWLKVGNEIFTYPLY